MKGKKKKAPKPKRRTTQEKRLDELKIVGNQTHKEDFDKVLEMLVPKVKPKGIKSDKLLEED